MAVTVDNTERKYSVPDILNRSLDKDTLKLFVEPLGYDGTGIQRLNAQNMQIKVTTVGDVTYVGKAAPGTEEATAKWQAKKIDSSVSGTTKITWADGGNFSQTASDLTSLTYV